MDVAEVIEELTMIKPLREVVLYVNGQAFTLDRIRNSVDVVMLVAGEKTVL